MVSLRRPSASTRANSSTQAAHPIVDLSERTDDQDGRGDAVVAQLTHDRDAVDIRKHAINRDHGIVAGDAAAQRLAAVRSQIHLVTAGRELFHDLTGGFRVVLNDQNTAVTSRHGLPSPTGWQKPNSVWQNRKPPGRNIGRNPPHVISGLREEDARGAR
jgi:hypothetical protein